MKGGTDSNLNGPDYGVPRKENSHILNKLRLVDLRENPHLIEYYVELRNRYASELMTNPITVELTEQWLKNHAGTILCAIQERENFPLFMEFLGACIIYKERNNEFAIFVEQSGHGIGGFIIGAMNWYCKRDGIKKVWARIKDGNERAKALFDKYFIRVGDVWEREIE